MFRIKKFGKHFRFVHDANIFKPAKRSKQLVLLAPSQDFLGTSVLSVLDRAFGFIMYIVLGCNRNVYDARYLKDARQFIIFWG